MGQEEILEYFLYRSAFLSSGERLPNSVLEISVGVGETAHIDSFPGAAAMAAKQHGSGREAQSSSSHSEAAGGGERQPQKAYQYGYVLIAANAHGYSEPSAVTYVKPLRTVAPASGGGGETGGWR